MVKFFGSQQGGSTGYPPGDPPPGTGEGGQTCACLEQCLISFSIKMESVKNGQRGGPRDNGGPPPGTRVFGHHVENKRVLEIKVRQKITEWCVTQQEADQLLAAQPPTSESLPKCLKNVDGRVQQRYGSGAGGGWGDDRGKSISRTLTGEIERLKQKESSPDCCAPTFEGETLSCLTVCNDRVFSTPKKCVDDCTRVKRIEKYNCTQSGTGGSHPKGTNWAICEVEQPRYPNQTPEYKCTITSQGDSSSPPPASTSDSDLMDSFDMGSGEGDEASGGMDWYEDEMQSSPTRNLKNYGRKVRNALRSSDCSDNSPSGKIKKAICAAIEDMMSDCVSEGVKCCKCCE